MIGSTYESISVEPSQFRRRVRGIVLGAAVLFESWAERRRQRRALRELSPHVLKDIGIGPGEAEREWRKPFWRA